MPHYWRSLGLTAGRTYAFNIFYDHFWVTDDVCGYDSFGTWNISRNASCVPVGNNPAICPSIDNALPVGSTGNFYTVGADITNVSAPIDAGDGKQNYVQVTFTATASAAQFYWGLHLLTPGTCTNTSAGARDWPGASLQTNVAATPIVPNATMLGGGGTLQHNPAGIVSASISGFKWNDCDSDGIFDINESRLGNWTIRLYSDAICTQELQNETTNASGYYLFSVTPGTYYVSEDLQTGWVQTAPSPACYGPIIVNQTNPTFTVNFGNHLPVTRKVKN